MNVQKRKELLVKTGAWITGKDTAWKAAMKKAYAHNQWFTEEFIELAAGRIAADYLQPENLDLLIRKYDLTHEPRKVRKVGIVMAGNIPLVGFHDLLCVFLSGQHAFIKLSSKDDVLMPHILEKMTGWEPDFKDYYTISSMIPNCDAYIATGSNNAARYFEYYFRKYPSIIRKNRTSVAILTGKESNEELEKLADDVYQYFGLGCRNVTKLYVPRNYDFRPMLQAFKKYDHLANHNKYRNNYEYNLAVHILNNQYYMTNGSILLVENESLFSPIAQLNYSYYSKEQDILEELGNKENIQCIIGTEASRFGSAQAPGICDYADGVDTMVFLKELSD